MRVRTHANACTHAHARTHGHTRTDAHAHATDVHAHSCACAHTHRRAPARAAMRGVAVRGTACPRAPANACARTRCTPTCCVLHRARGTWPARRCHTYPSDARALRAARACAAVYQQHTVRTSHARHCNTHLLIEFSGNGVLDNQTIKQRVQARTWGRGKLVGTFRMARSAVRPVLDQFHVCHRVLETR